MWFLLLLLYIAHIELVFLQGDVNRLILRSKNGKNPCEGHIEIYHNGVRGYVGEQYWSEKTEEVVCRSTHCGSPESRASGTLRPEQSMVLLNELECEGNESQLWNCKNPGWGISKYKQDAVKWIECSNKIKITLEGYECAGIVKYSSGSEEGYFCSNNWGEKQAERLCKTLGCGTSKEIPEKEWMDFNKIQHSKMMMIDCSGLNETNLWQCTAQKEKQECKIPATVICTGFKKLQLKGDEANVCSGILEMEENGDWKPVNSSSKSAPDVWCQHMHCGTSVSYSFNNGAHHLNCTDNVQVVLKSNAKNDKCYGEVQIKVNDFTHSVCGSSLTHETAEVVCKELKCGAVVDQYTRPVSHNGIMDNVECSGKESSLWHCRGKHNNNPCTKKAFVVCSESVKVRLADGPGKCAGRVEIQHEGKWKRVSTQKWTNLNSDIVCKELKCGGARSGDSETFSQGSADFLNKLVSCSKGFTSIYECITKFAQAISPSEMAKMITCEGHKVVFLNDTCSGMVGIQHGNKTYWLSGSKNTWNQESANTVCEQMQCGKASKYENFPSADMKKDVWHESFNCSSNTKSLFDCKKTKKKLPSDHNDTIAYVKCSGAITVNLTEGCYGTVNVCLGEKCGGVCKGSWTKEKSMMLCKDLGCGDKILTSGQKIEKEPIFKSLHTTTHTTSLSQCNFINNDESGEKATKCELATVVCSGSVKAQFSASRQKCYGNVNVQYEGNWLPVCRDALEDPKTQNAICGELNCGHVIKQVNYFGPTSTTGYAITKIQCPNIDTKSLTECDIVSEKSTCTLVGLQCSSWRKMELKYDEACSGAVFVHSEKNRNPVSIEGWTKTEMDRLCKDLECGSYTSYKNKTIKSFDSFWNSSFSCASNITPKNIWDCETQTVPSQKQQLWIECQDKLKVTLSENCSGEVRMDDTSVCSSNWNHTYSHMVCQQQNCSNAIDMPLYYNKEKRQDTSYHHVSCEDYHHRLSQCSRYQEKCDAGPVSVYCVGNVKFRTTEKCGGQIEVKYKNDEWEKVCLTSNSARVSKLLCKELGCHDSIINPYSNNNQKKKKVNLKTTLNCEKNNNDIKHCVKIQSCDTDKPAEIYCKGYVKRKEDGPIPKPTPVVPIILGVGFLLFLVILIVVFVRVYIVRKGKKSMNVPSRMFSRQEPDLEFDSGDYEDVTNKANEMEDFSRGRFRSEAEVIMESDARSTSSLPYDDIDEVVETQPLTSQASGDRYIHDGALDQSSDGVTYEVDDPQENYDDIEAGPEITQTEAEVHDSPQTTPESVTATPPGLMQKADEDYLVPGEDG
ncbi:scavenger receptor cysteine-rich type 1 protein M130 [Morone saxatilis]|uniref:scavenger receptor cysteine-rich type 1 protein M130 n=1 Tax=Morone saxatilis TaxID=34816 RepID=UPI0015E1FA1F|nr:scavenger receptor cysteine-rich type 1 protein M130 [Morone saxatilis]